MPKRTLIHLDEALLARAERLMQPQQLSQLLNELLAKRLGELERAELETELREGYLATRQERRQIAAEWQAADNEGWPA